MSSIYTEIAAILILILANGFFSLSEFSIIASRRSRLKRFAKEGRRGAVKAEKILARPENFLATVQIGITLVATIAGVFSGMTLVNSITPYIQKIPISFIAESAKSIAFLIVVLGIALMSIIIGELVPKYLAMARPEKIASAVSCPMMFFIKVGSLPVKILSGTARFITRLFGSRRIGERSSLTEDEINFMIAEGREKGVFDPEEEELVRSVFNFTDRLARQAMTPRTDITGIDITSTKDEIFNIIIESGFSRYPVYSETLDHIEGIIYTKDIIRAMHQTEFLTVNDIIRKSEFVPDSMELTTILKRFQQKRVHAAIVLDEFGGTAGMITLEDLLEEIVGEIQDEHDTVELEFVRKTKSVAFADGSLRVDELNEQFDTSLPEGGADTLGGLVFEGIGHLPEKGEEYITANVKFTILEVEGNRLRRLRIEKLLGHQDNSGEHN